MTALEMVMVARQQVVFVAEMFLAGFATDDELRAAVQVAKATARAWHDGELDEVKEAA